MTTAIRLFLISLLKAWRDVWRSLEGPELEPNLWHSHFLTAYHSGRALRCIGAYLEGEIIDIGAGTGHGARYLNPEMTKCYPTDLPSGRSSLDPGISRRSHAPSMHCSIYDLPFSAARFDGALLLNVLAHLAATAKGSTDPRRMLKPGAFLLSCVPFAFLLHGLPDDYRRWTGQGLRHEFEALGFELVELLGWGGTASSLVCNLNFFLRCEAHALISLTPILILLLGVFNLLALMAEHFLPNAIAFPTIYVGLARKRVA